MSKIYILDTNVLLHDPKSLFAFEDNEVVIPLVVLDELDKKKVGGHDETARHARMVIRSLDKMRDQGSIHKGVKTNSGGLIRVELNCRDHCPSDLDPNRVDNRLISVVIGLKEANPDTKISLITKDINLRVKCDALGITAEDYNADSVAENPNSIYEGTKDILTTSENIDKLYKDGSIDCSELDKSEIGECYENQYIHIRSNTKEKHSSLAKYFAGVLNKITPVGNVWGISPRNKEQVFGFDALFDNDVKLVTMTGPAGTGKAGSLDSLVYTPNGPVKMRDTFPGMNVITPDGGVAKIVSIHPQGKKKIYKVIFTDGSYTECCDEHLWYTRTSTDRDAGRSGSVKSLGEIMKSLRYGKSNKRNHSIPITKPVYFNNTDISIDPYVLGVLLGDGGITGTPTLSTADETIYRSVKEYAEQNKMQLIKRSKYDYYITKEYNSNGKRSCSQIKNPLTLELKRLKLHGKKSEDKFIPRLYKINSIETRIAVLQGLMDTDGTVSKNVVSFSSVSRKLAEDVMFIVQSLGGTATVSSRFTTYTYNGKKRVGKKSYRVTIVLPNDIMPFRLDRKRKKVLPRVKYFPRRYIDRVEFVGEKEAQCIYIDSNDHLYLTDQFIVTHNTLLAAAAGISQVLDSHDYKRLILTRPVQPLGRDIGYLPGDIDDKMAPWMAPLQDNLELLFSDKGKGYLDMQKESGVIEVNALTYIRGRSIPKTFIIVDEAQNLTLHEVKTIITRVGEGSKLVLTGDILQIDNPYIDSVDNGLSCAIEKFKIYQTSAHITLQKGERSELATLASNIL